MATYDTAKVEEHWSKVDCSASEKDFYNFPPIRARSSELIFGESDALRKDWCEYWTVERYLKKRMPFGKCLSVCCGFGEVERILSRMHVADKIVGTDIAPGSIEQAKQRAQDEGLTNIEYFVADLNTEKLPKKEYDIIWANGALHHIRDLDTVIPKLLDALKDDGILIANEYVGPNYQQIGVRQQEIINAVRHLLPEELCGKDAVLPQRPRGSSLRCRGIRYVRRVMAKILSRLVGDQEGAYAKIYEPLPLAHFMETDPSECVDSENIVRVLKRHFSDIDVRYYDGSILSYALDRKFYDNYDAQNPKHKMVLDMLFRIEDTMIAAGELSRDNAHIICRKKVRHETGTERIPKDLDRHTVVRSVEVS